VPDISMCDSTTCAVAARCRRNPASGTKADVILQSWMEFEPEKASGCSGFWPSRDWPSAKDTAGDMTHLQRGPSPAESELSGTPIIDDWEIRAALSTDDGSRHHVVVGIVSGDRRWNSGCPIRTSTVAAIDCDRRWVRTQNTLYRLGRARSLMPLITEAICRPTWTEAWEHVCGTMGRHTVSDFIWKVATTHDADWGRQRVRAALVASEMRNVGRTMIADAWRLLAVDATDTKAAGEIYEILCVTTGIDQTPQASDAIDGWGRMARGDTRGVDLSDPIAAAHRLGEPRGMDVPAAREALRELMEDDIDPPAAGPRPVGTGVVVLQRVGGTTETSSGREAVKEFKDIAGVRLPLVAADGIDAARTALRAEFPHLHLAIGMLLGDLRDGAPIRLRATLLVGPPGGGKSRLVRRLAAALGIGLHRFDGAASGDNAFGGTPRRWSSGEHAVPLEAVRRFKIANPLMMIDEIDKAAQRGNNGSLPSALMPYLERETSVRFPDPFVQSDVDLSHVSYLLTANDDTALPSPLRDRLRVIKIPEPGIDHMIPLARGTVADIARENGGDARWYPDLDDAELAIVETLWPGGSVRRLRAIVERLLARRESNPRN
jgi:ATPase family protein associated with various cellular activities (AAA)/uncharacterized protein DUF6634